jgi:hypothetical protein
MQESLVDASLSDGQLGVVVQTLSEPGVIVNFDNLIVNVPEEGI